MVHHAVKRFMIILPAIFFKLGVAFTLLILVALAAVNNGFIGFLILVVGLSSVLSRMQQSQPHAVPLVAPPAWPHPYIDRSDNPVPIYRTHESYPKMRYAQAAMDRSDTDYVNQIQRLNDLVQQNRNGLGTNYRNTEVIYNKYVPSN